MTTVKSFTKAQRLYDNPSKKRGGWLVGDIRIIDERGTTVASFEIIVREVVFEPWETFNRKREVLCYPSLLDEQDCEVVSVHPHQCMAFVRYMGLSPKWAQDLLRNIGLFGAYRITSEQAAIYSANGKLPP